MDQLLSRLAKIKDKVKALKSQNERLLLEQKKTEQTITRLQKLIEIQNNSIQKLEQQLKIKRIADQVGAGESLSPNENRELKYKINEIIKEVDKVIALIHE
ncbi:MAG: hypothetical protein PSX81_15910 [bacterium]|nr:hypothetical protein [bacterium]